MEKLLTAATPCQSPRLGHVDLPKLSSSFEKYLCDVEQVSTAAHMHTYESLLKYLKVFFQ